MSSSLGSDSVDRANRMAAIRMRRRAPDPNVGSHLPAPANAAPPPSNKEPAPAAAHAKHGRRATSTETPLVIENSADLNAAGSPPHAPAVPSPPKMEVPQLPVRSLPPSKVHYMSGPSVNNSPRVEAQPLGLTQIFSKNTHQSMRDQINSHSAPPSSLIGDILQEGREPTTKPSPDLVRCADYVQTQPDSLDAFLRKYAVSGGGHIPTPRGGANNNHGGGGGYQTHPPLRLMPVPGTMSQIQEISSNNSTPRQHAVPGGAAVPNYQGCPQPPSDDPSNMLLAESTFVQRPKAKRSRN